MFDTFSEGKTMDDLINPFKVEYPKEVFDDDIPLIEYNNFDEYLKFYMLQVINYHAEKSGHWPVEEIDKKYFKTSEYSSKETTNSILEKIDAFRKTLANTNSDLLTIVNDFFENFFKRNRKESEGISKGLEKRVCKSESFFAGIRVSDEQRREEARTFLKLLNGIRLINGYQLIHFKQVIDDLEQEILQHMLKYF